MPTHAKDRWRLQPEVIENHCRVAGDEQKLLLLNYPNNPTGGTYPAGLLAEIAEVAKRHRITIMSDEIYGALHFEGAHHSIASDYPEGTIISNGISKWCGAGGWRLGTFVFPEHHAGLQNAMAVVASETFTSTSAPIQHAAISAFVDAPEMDLYIRGCRRVLKAVAREVYGLLRHYGVNLEEAEGGFYVFPDFEPFRTRLAARSVNTSAELCGQLLQETGVALLPGSDFGRAPEELVTRLSFVDFNGKEALEAEKREGSTGDLSPDFVGQYAPRVLEAMHRLGAWLKD